MRRTIWIRFQKSKLLSKLFSLLILLSSAQVWAEDIDQSIGSIHKIDMTDERAKGPDFVVVTLDLKKLRVPGSHAHVILRQFRKRCRIEFEGSGLPKGSYTLAKADSCLGNSTDLHSFSVSSTHAATEKSLPGAVLTEYLPKFLILKNKSGVVDCKAFRSGP